MNQNRSDTREAWVVKEKLEHEPTNSASLAAGVRHNKTFAVASALSCGVPILDFTRAIDGKDPSHSTWTFALQPTDAIRFGHDFPAETIDLKELLKRLNDVEWIKENSEHPIAYMYWALRNYSQLVKAIRDHKPFIVFTRGKNEAFCVAGGDPERNRYVLQKAGFRAAEIDEIMKQIP